jgi:hypothetical protein
MGASGRRRGIPDARPQSQRPRRRRLGALRCRHAAARGRHGAERIRRSRAIRSAIARRQRRRPDLACRRHLAGAHSVGGFQCGWCRSARRDATAGVVRAHVVRDGSQSPALHRSCGQFVALLGVGKRRASRASDHGRRLLPVAGTGRSDSNTDRPLPGRRTCAHSPGTGNRWHSDRTAARNCSSFAAVACDCIASTIHCAT